MTIKNVGRLFAHRREVEKLGEPLRDQTEKKEGYAHLEKLRVPAFGVVLTIIFAILVCRFSERYL